MIVPESTGKMASGGSRPSLLGSSSFIGLSLMSILFNMPTFAQGSAVTPANVVQQWILAHPNNMPGAAKLLTARGLNGLSQEEWIATHGHELQRMELTYLHHRIVHEHLVREDLAHVVVTANIRTIIGVHYHRELFTLQRNSQGDWLIDDVQEYDENYLGFPI